MDGRDLILELCHEAGDVGSEDEIVKEMRSKQTKAISESVLHI